MIALKHSATYYYAGTNIRGVDMGVVSRRDILGLSIGLALGILLLVVTSIVLNQPLFGVTWTPRQEYYLRIDPAYIYLRVENISNNTPLLRGKTLIWYIIIIRIENPYNNTVELRTVEAHLPENVFISNCGKQGKNITATITIGANRTREAQKEVFSVSGNVLFDAWINKTICGYGFSNDLLRDSAKRVFDRSTQYWINGGDPRFNHLYVVITGVTELPTPWKYRLQELQKPQYLVLAANGRMTKTNDLVEALKIMTINLTRIDANTYVYDAIPKGLGFDLEGTLTINTYYNGTWP